MTTVTIAKATVDEFADYVRYWNEDEVLGRMNMSEGFMFARLFEELGREDIAEHIVREVWLGEDEDCRDPEPWANGHGSRLSEEEWEARKEDLQHNEGKERFYFAPRHGYEWEAELEAAESAA